MLKKKNERSLGIFCFYDSQGIVDDYVLYLLDSLASVLSKIVVVVNGKIECKSYNRLMDVVNEIIIRENKGYDGAAYRDVLLNHCVLTEWDEIVLLNGTFYGPFVDWRLIFDRMRKFDFWGLDKKKVDEKEYLCSYFLVFGREIIRDASFIQFWENMKIPQTYYEDFKEFEEPLVEHFSSKGFSWSDWYSENRGRKEESLSVFQTHLLKDLVEDYSFPIIKYKQFSVAYYSYASRSKDYIISSNVYDYGLIEQHHSRLEAIGCMYPFSKNVLDNFLNKYDSVYIFGHGTYGKGIACYCMSRGKKISGFVVSSPQCKDEVSIKEIELREKEGLIVAVCARLRQEVKTQIEENCLLQDVLFPI